MMHCEIDQIQATDISGQRADSIQAIGRPEILHGTSDHHKVPVSEHTVPT